VALSADGERWFLVNASPDLRAQIEGFPPLQPRGVRGSPIEGVLLTNPDLDHTLGLFLLRGADGVRILSAGEIPLMVADGLRLDRTLERYGGVRWEEIGEQMQPLTYRDRSGSGLECRAIPLPASPPLYWRDGAAGAHSFAFEVLDTSSGKRALIAPDVQAVTPELRAAMAVADVVLFDGTFWSEDELQRISPRARSAREMGHLTVQESLPELAGLRGRRVYLHINNTNPILRPGAAERAEVEAAGVEVGVDGADFTIRA
jgi:pyrroloquinoline quinone biosynthesis protein B